MKWGIVFASTGFPTPDAARNMVQAAEAAGFESLWCPEHVVSSMAPGHAPYASESGSMERLWRRGGIPDPIVWLTFAAAQTTTVRLSTNVVILPEHHPTVFAKSVAILDQLSGGGSCSVSASAPCPRSTQRSAWISPTAASGWTNTSK